MKKLLFSLLGVLMAFPVLASTDRYFTYEYEGQTLRYTILDDNTCAVADYNSVSGTIVIPAVAKNGDMDYSVVSIRDYAFSNCKALNSIELPNSVTSIGKYAFDSCEALTSIELPESITSIGNNVFQFCRALTSIELPNSITSIGSNAFICCGSLTSIELPESITSIGFNAFMCCESLTSIELPESITSIGSHAFCDCSALTSIKLPDSIISIGEFAFSGSALTSIKLPNSIISIEEGSFNNCTALTSIELPNSITSIGDNAFSGCSALTSIELPESITSIGERAFSGCSALTSIELPDFLISIRNNAFDYCTALTSIELPDSLTSIGSEAFRGCGLTRIKLPSSLKILGSAAFYDNKIVSVKGGENIEKIDAAAFLDCRVSRFDFGENIKFIGDKAFGDEIKVLSFGTSVPPTLESANMGYESDIAYNILVLVPVNGDDAYKNHNDWKGFYITENISGVATVQMSGQYSLAEEIRTQTGIMPGAVTQLAINGPLSDTDWMVIQRNLLACHTLDLSGVTNTTIPNEAFKGNGRLLNVTLPKSLDVIGMSAFEGCRNLRISSLPSGLTSIGKSAFRDCTSLELEELPESMKRIGINAFSNCESLNLTSLPALESIGYSAFSGCTRLKEIDLSKTQITLLGINGEDSYGIWDAGCFDNCSKLRTVILPETLTEIGVNAFSHTSVNFINFPKSLTTIGAHAFEDTPLIAADLSEKLESISDKAFNGCDRLATVNLSPKTTQIGMNAFEGCMALSNLSVPCATPPEMADGAFNKVPTRDCVVAIPTLAYRDYLNAPGWGGFTQLSNFLSMPLVIEDENGDAVDPESESGDDVTVSVAENGNYDDTVETITSEEEQAAEDKVRDEEFFGNSETENKVEIENRVRRARAAARENTAVIEQKAKRAFMRLHSGSQMTIGDNKGYRVRIACKPGVEIAKVEFNGKDVTGDMVDDILILPELTNSSNLKITRKGEFGSVHSIEGDAATKSRDIYNMQGILIKANAAQSDIDALLPGLYIIAGKKVVIK
ncbi:MAG: leucine-rich repeat protein [Muribaculaceae bacterium]|nr:leucine-rich repeat protein [Muribaculaceae bacterium]